MKSKEKDQLHCPYNYCTLKNKIKKQKKKSLIGGKYFIHGQQEDGKNTESVTSHLESKVVVK